MASGANQTKYRHGAISGVTVRWECLIAPEHLIAAGFSRPAARGDHAAIGGTVTWDQSGGGVVADIDKFCKAIGYGRMAYFQVRSGTRNPTDNFRYRVAQVLKLPEDQLFRRKIEGEA